MYKSYAETLESYKISDEPSTVKIDQFETDDGTAYKNTFFNGDTEIGHCCVCTYKRKNDFLFNLEVKKSIRGQGYGSEIVKYMIDKYNVKYLIVGKDNIIAQNLYKKFKFKVDEEINSKFIRMKR
jgi:GNAT superfamily N-acetyltransferase